MADAQVIKEFLVAVGVKIDDTQQRRFFDFMSQSGASAKELDKKLEGVISQLGVLGEKLINLADRPTRTAENAAERLMKKHELLDRNLKQLGFTAAATTSTLVAGFVEIARQYDNLYYVQQRTGVGGTALAGMGFLGSQIGVGPQAIVSATEALATAARNPGLQNILRSWGVVAHDGKLMDDALMRFVAHVRTMPAYLQDAYAQMFGVPVELMRNMINNFDFLQAKSREWADRTREAGIDYNKTMQDANTITRGLGDMWSQIETIGVKAFSETSGAIEFAITKANEFLRVNNKLLGQAPGLGTAETVAGGALGVSGVLSGLGMFGFGAAGAAGAMGMGALGLPAAGAAGMMWARAYLLGKLTPAQRAQAEQMDLGGGSAAGGFQHGGIVPITAHAGEMILPSNISSGLQSLFAGGGGMLGVFTQHFREWLQGSAAFHPYVQVIGLTPGAPISAGGGGTVPAPDPGRGFGGGGGASIGGGGGGGIHAGGGVANSTGGGKYSPEANITPGSDEAMARQAIAAAGGNELAQAGLLANFYAESGLRRDRPGPGGDFGWAQWIGSRKKALFAYAQAHNLNPYSAEAQAGYLHQELMSPQYQKMIQRMNASGSATAAAIISGFIFEQGGGNASLFGGGRFSQAGMDRFHSAGAENIYKRIHGIATGAGSRPAFPPDLVKYNSRGEPYAASLEHLSPEAKAAVEASRKAGFPHTVPDWLRDYTAKTLGGNVTVHHDAGDRSVDVTQNNHFHGSGAPDDDALAALHRYAAALSRNVSGVIT